MIEYIERNGIIFQIDREHPFRRYDPVTPFLLAGAIAASVGGQIYSGMAQRAEAKSAEAMANYNAQVREREAEAIEQRTRIEQRKQAQEAARRQSTLLAQLGQAGAVSTVGAPLAIQAEQAAEDELDNLYIGYEGQVEAQRARSAAVGERYAGKLESRRLKNKATGSFIGAGTSLLEGFHSYKEKYG